MGLGGRSGRCVCIVCVEGVYTLKNDMTICGKEYYVAVYCIARVPGGSAYMPQKALASL